MKKKGLKIKSLDNVIQKIAKGIGFCQYLEAINKESGGEKKKLACNASEICLV